MTDSIGTLIVVVLKAKNLHDKHSFYKQDVFAEVKLSGTTKRTHVDIKGGQHPVWDEELRFPVIKSSSEKNRKLQVACYAKEPRSEDILGKGTVNITGMLKTGEFDDWVELETNGTIRGEIYLEMTFYSSAPSSKLSIESSNFVRRPSKLSHSDRLSRPSPSQVHAKPPLKYNADPVVLGHSNEDPIHFNVMSPASPRLSSVRPDQRKNMELPPIPNDDSQGASFVPPSLRIGSKSHSKGVPPVLFPGESNHNHQQRGGLPNLHVTPPLSLTPSLAPVSQKVRSTSSPTPSQSSTSGISPQYIPQPRYEAPTSETRISPVNIIPSALQGIAFPIPSLPPSEDNYGPSNIQVPSLSPYQKQADGLEQGPRLCARYQSPLPLPVESNPTKLPGPGVGPSRPRPSSQLNSDGAAINKRHQEEMDREMALQLDKELNL